MLKDKCGVVTGAANGIGAATALCWVENGAKVVCADINEQQLTQVVEEINSVHPNSAVACVTDVSKIEDTRRLVECCVTKFGKLDIFFANAGILPKRFPIEHEMEKSFMHVLETNLLSVFMAIKYASQAIKSTSGSGSIICTGSIAAMRADLSPLSYTASKGGLLSIVHSANDELLLDGIRVNAVLPGGVVTNLALGVMKHLDEDGFEINNYDYDRFPPIHPEKVAQVVTFLASDLSSGVKG